MWYKFPNCRKHERGWRSNQAQAAEHYSNVFMLNCQHGFISPISWHSWHLFCLFSLLPGKSVFIILSHLFIFPLYPWAGAADCCGGTSSSSHKKMSPDMSPYVGQTNCTLMIYKGLSYARIQAKTVGMFSVTLTDWTFTYSSMHWESRRLMTNICASLQEQQNEAASEDQAQSAHTHTILNMQSNWISSNLLASSSFPSLQLVIFCSAVLKLAYTVSRQCVSTEKSTPQLLSNWLDTREALTLDLIFLQVSRRTTNHTSSQTNESLSTCKVLCLEMQVTQLVDVTDVHVLLVDLRFVEVLGSSKTKKIMFTSFSRVEMFINLCWDTATQASHHEVDRTADFLGLHLVSFHAVPEKQMVYLSHSSSLMTEHISATSSLHHL